MFADLEYKMLDKIKDLKLKGYFESAKRLKEMLDRYRDEIEKQYQKQEEYKNQQEEWKNILGTINKIN